MCWIPDPPVYVQRDTSADDDARQLCREREQWLNDALDAIVAAYPGGKLTRFQAREWASDGWPAYNVEHPSAFWDAETWAHDWPAFFRALDAARLTFEEYLEELTP